MKQAAAKTTETPHANRPEVLGAIGMDLANTTWRIAVPVVLAAILGIVTDRTLGTAPWLTLVAVVLGFVVAGWLIKKQLKTLEERGE